MILPTKYLSEERCLIGVGSEVFSLITEGKTVSKLWSDYKESTAIQSCISYDWFILSLDFLYSIQIIGYVNGKIRRLNND